MKAQALRTSLVLSLLIGTVVVGSASQAAIGDCVDKPAPLARVPATPQSVFLQTNFTNGGSQTPSGWGSSADYADDECDRLVATVNGDSVLRQTILPGATHGTSDSGDVSINRKYEPPVGVSSFANMTFSASALTDIWSYGTSGDFRARVKISTCRAVGCTGSDLIKEYIGDLCTTPTRADVSGNCQAFDNGETNEKVITAATDLLTSEVKYITVNFRAREQRTEGAHGTAVLTQISLTRVL